MCLRGQSPKRWEGEGEGGMGERQPPKQELKRRQRAQETCGDKTPNLVLAASTESVYRFSVLSELIYLRVKQRVNKMFSGQI